MDIDLETELLGQIEDLKLALVAEQLRNEQLEEEVARLRAAILKTAEFVKAGL